MQEPDEFLVGISVMRIDLKVHPQFIFFRQT
jgi:hypothetical protein